MDNFIMMDYFKGLLPGGAAVVLALQFAGCATPPEMIPNACDPNNPGGLAERKYCVDMDVRSLTAPAIAHLILSRNPHAFKIYHAYMDQLNEDLAGHDEDAANLARTKLEALKQTLGPLGLTDNKIRELEIERARRGSAPPGCGEVRGPDGEWLCGRAAPHLHHALDLAPRL